MFYTYHDSCSYAPASISGKNAKRLEDLYFILQSLRLDEECSILDVENSEVVKLLLSRNKKSQLKIMLSNPPYSNVQLGKIKNIASSIREKYTNLVIIGMGGAILNPMAVLNFGKYCSINDDIDVHYVYYLDLCELKRLSLALNFEKTAFLVISQSGNTTETVALCRYFIDISRKRGLVNLGKNFYFILGNLASDLGNIANAIDAIVLRHDPHITGRFSTFTNVVLLPAQILGLDIEEFCNGGATVLDRLYNNIDNESINSALVLTKMIKDSFHTVDISYLHNLDFFLQWHLQIVTESLGKDAINISHTCATCPLDQHRQFQLYLDGAKNKLFTLFFVNDSCSVLQGSADINAYEYGKPLTVNSVLNTCYQTTVESFIEKKLPTRSYLLQELSMKSLGELMMHMIVETILTGCLLGINPFGQPQIDAIKQNLRTRLCQFPF
ncbi:Glucose-6-phosphate isomerase (modular protein) [Alphaproteobacteria bacterium]